MTMKFEISAVLYGGAVSYPARLEVHALLRSMNGVFSESIRKRYGNMSAIQVDQAGQPFKNHTMLQIVASTLENTG